MSGTNGPVLLSLPVGLLKHWLFSLLDSGTSFSQGAEHGLHICLHASARMPHAGYISLQEGST